MASVVQLRRSSVPGHKPDTPDLAMGEVVVNTHDGKLFFKVNDGTDAIVEVQAVPASPVDYGSIAAEATSFRDYGSIA